MGRIMDIKRKLKRLRRRGITTEEQRSKEKEFKQILSDWEKTK